MQGCELGSSKREENIIEKLTRTIHQKREEILSSAERLNNMADRMWGSIPKDPSCNVIIGEKPCL